MGTTDVFGTGHAALRRESGVRGAAARPLADRPGAAACRCRRWPGTAAATGHGPRGRRPRRRTRCRARARRSVRGCAAAPSRIAPRARPGAGRRSTRARLGRGGAARPGLLRNRFRLVDLGRTAQPARGLGRGAASHDSGLRPSDAGGRGRTARDRTRRRRGSGTRGRRFYGRRSGAPRAGRCPAARAALPHLGPAAAQLRAARPAAGPCRGGDERRVERCGRWCLRPRRVRDGQRGRHRRNGGRGPGAFGDAARSRRRTRTDLAAGVMIARSHRHRTPRRAMTTFGLGTEPIAVIGAACRVPGAESPDELWELLRGGIDATGPAPVHRWGAEAAPPPGGYLDRVDLFDADFFGISPREAAGIPVGQLETGGPAAVFLGAMWDDYAGLTRDQSAFTRHTFAGLRRGMVANRVSHALGAHGPSFTLDSAQSSSLVAVHLACESLRSGEAAVALAGGVNVVLGPSVAETGEFGGLSPTGRCRPFDADADGFARGEGGGVVVLKTLSRARADGDRVQCVLLGSATNNDGGDRPVAVPSVEAQVDVLRAAHRRSGVEPGEIGYRELHGTGTRVGDVTEASALGTVFGSGHTRPEALPVGSVKSNIGHLESAAGVLGLLKAALCVERGALVPSLHFTTPAEDIPLDELGLAVPTAVTPWENDRRVEAVSSFGMGGTNCHLVLADPGPDPAPGIDGAEASGDAHGPWPVVLTGNSSESVRDQATTLRGYLRATPARVPDVAWSAATTRTPLSHRAVVVAGDSDELDARLEALAGPDGAIEAVRPGRSAFVFSGQGGARPGMGAELGETVTDVATVLETVTDALRPHLETPLRDVLRAEDGTRTAALLRTATYAQPALFALQVALYRFAEHRGAVPDVVSGHSLGEITAAHVAGGLALEPAARLVAERGRLTDTLPGDGKMIAVRAAADDVEPLLVGHESEAAIAGVNGPRSCVVSGAAAAVEAVADACRAAGWRVRALEVTHAFHSPHVDAITDAFGAAIASLPFAPVSMPVVSASLGRLAAPAELADPAHWVRHLREPVLFDDAVRALLDHGVHTFTEVGPDGSLTALANERLAAAGAGCAPMLRPGRPEVADTVGALGRLHARGAADLDWNSLLADAAPRRVALPGYTFRRRSFWLPTTTPDTSAPTTVTTRRQPAPEPAPAAAAESAPVSPGKPTDVLAKIG